MARRDTNGKNPIASSEAWPGRKSTDRRTNARRAKNLQRVAEHLLIRFIRPNNSPDQIKRDLADILAVSRDTIDAYLQELTNQGIVIRPYTVNSKATRFHYEHRIAISINSTAVPENRTLTEHFTHLIETINHEQPIEEQRFLITDAVSLLGGIEGCDVLLSVLSDDPEKVGDYVLERLRRDRCVQKSVTMMVNWRYSLPETVKSDQNRGRLAMATPTKRRK